MLSFPKAVAFVFRILCKHLDRKVKSCSRSHSKDRERSPNAWATTAFCACQSMASNFKTPLRRDRNKRRRKGRDVSFLAFRKRLGSDWKPLGVGQDEGDTLSETNFTKLP